MHRSRIGIIVMLLAAFGGVQAVGMRSGAAQTIPLIEVPRNLPRPLSGADVMRYQQIFALQQAKEWKQADVLIDALDDDILLGRVLAQRYLHPTGWRSTYTELTTWLARYSDHPAASRIAWLANKRRPAGAAAPPPPKKGYLNGYGRATIGGAYIAIPTHYAGRRAPARTKKLARDVRTRIRSGWPTGGRELLTEGNLNYLTRYEEAVLRADIAHGYFIYGKDLSAIAQARQAIALAGRDVPQAYWTAGMAAWRHGDTALAMVFLRTLAENDAAAPSLISAAAFWASRGALRGGDIEASFRYLDTAAATQDSFYGMLAAEMLGQDITLDFSLPGLRPDFIDWLNATPGGRRTFALLQVGETYHASRELRYLWEDMTFGQQRQTMVLAAQTHMAGLSFRAADILRREYDQHWYAALYPIPDFETEAALRVDQALLLAVMRQESGFNPRAQSWAKASGLMQLMPATAAFIARDRRLKGTRRHDLMIPEVNIRLGEDYILHLFDAPPVNGDLMRLLAAYNGGPGNLKKWMRQVDHDDDTLMLLESLPSRETRFYVKNVLTNYWIYRKRLGKEGDVLASIAAGGIDTGGDGFAQPDAHLLGQSCTLMRLSERCAYQP